jgi:hypothetical protein
MNKILALGTICLLAFASCKKAAVVMNEVQHKAKSLEDFLALTTKDNRGRISITESSGFKRALTTGPQIVISGGLNEKNSDQKRPGGDAKFSTVSISPSSDFRYFKQLTVSSGDENLFGKRVSIEIKGAPNAARTGMSEPTIFGSIETPQIMVVSNEYQPTVYGLNMEFIQANDLSTGSTINWNANTSNDKGVFFFVEYEPTDPTNATFSTAYPDHVANGVVVADNGSYQITEELLDGIPAGAKVKLYIGRGNYTYLMDADNTLSEVQVYSLTYQYGIFRVL